MAKPKGKLVNPKYMEIAQEIISLIQKRCPTPNDSMPSLLVVMAWVLKGMFDRNDFDKSADFLGGALKHLYDEVDVEPFPRERTDH